jgi:hypothetical protein
MRTVGIINKHRAQREHVCAGVPAGGSVPANLAIELELIACQPGNARAAVI